MDAVRERAGQFGRCDDERQQKDDLK